MQGTGLVGLAFNLKGENLMIFRSCIEDQSEISFAQAAEMVYLHRVVVLRAETCCLTCKDEETNHYFSVEGSSREILVLRLAKQVTAETVPAALVMSIPEKYSDLRQRRLSKKACQMAMVFALEHHAITVPAEKQSGRTFWNWLRDVSL